MSSSESRRLGHAKYETRHITRLQGDQTDLLDPGHRIAAAAAAVAGPWYECTTWRHNSRTHRRLHRGHCSGRCPRELRLFLFRGIAALERLAVGHMAGTVSSGRHTGRCVDGHRLRDLSVPFRLLE